MINFQAVEKAAEKWMEAKPFPHLVVDGFFDAEVASGLEAEFPSFDADVWQEYGNALEVKKTCNDWNAFPSLTYRAFGNLNSEAFVEWLSNALFGKSALTPDAGLNGGGWHIHRNGGKLNTHLDYSIHPKLSLQRKINVIVYLNSEWRQDWGGSLGFWGNESAEHPGPLEREIESVFNRAVIFDTTCNSWHGLPNPLTCPEDQFRKSIAVYYMTEPPSGVDRRGKALFAPTEEQKGDEAVAELIRKRASVESAASVYSKKS